MKKFSVCDFWFIAFVFCLILGILSFPTFVMLLTFRLIGVISCSYFLVFLPLINGIVLFYLCGTIYSVFKYKKFVDKEK